MKSTFSSHIFPWEPVDNKDCDNRQTGLSSSRWLAQSLVSLGSACVAISLMTTVPLVCCSEETGLIVNRHLTQRKTTTKCTRPVILMAIGHLDGHLISLKF